MPAHETLLAGLFSAEARQRAAAQQELRRLGPEALEALAEVAQGRWEAPRVKRPTGFLHLGPDPRVLAAEARRLAIWLMGEIPGPAATEALWQTAQTTGDVPTRYTAALALAERGDQRAVPVLVNALTCENFEVRASAAVALGQLGNREAVEPLLATMRNDGQPVPRFKAMQALGQLGDRRATPALIEILNHLMALPAHDWTPLESLEFDEARQLVWTSCQYALEALERLDDPRALPVLDQLAHAAPARTIGSKAWQIARTLRERHQLPPLAA